MAKWNKYVNRSNIEIADTFSKKIITTLGEIRQKFNDHSLQGGKTNEIKNALILLGYKNCCCVYSCMKESTSQNLIIKKSHDDLKNEYKKAINDYIDRKREEFGFNAHVFKNSEWLYDLHWYKDNPNTDYMTKALPLVAEFELGNRRELDNGKSCKQPYSAVRFDFQKLLVANADIRLMVFQVANFERDIIESEKGLNIYFDNAIKGYDNLKGKYNFLFACYSKNDFHYTQIKGAK